MKKYTELKKKFREACKSNVREAAEIAYVLARLYLKEGDARRAKDFGRRSISLFNQCRMETIEECSSRFAVLEGIALPSYIHQKVVKDRLSALNL